jgi:hypothetical protein
MDSWREELERFIAQGLEDSDDKFEVQLMEDIFFALEEPPLEQGMPGSAGSQPGRKHVHRDREACHDHLVKDYFDENPTFDAMKFRQRYRMRHELFLRLIDVVCSFDPWFVQGRDALGRLGLPSLQKCTAALQMLAYGVPANACDEYCRLGESTALVAMKRWVVAMKPSTCGNLLVQI